MAIYNNREVSVISPTRQATAPATVVVQYKDGSHETVGMGGVRFTEEEKKNLVKQYPSEFDNVQTISDEDVKSVQAGVAPSYDPDRKEQAKAQVKTEEAQKIDQQLRDKAKADAQKDMKSDKSQPQPIVAGPNAPTKSVK